MSWAEVESPGRSALTIWFLTSVIHTANLFIFQKHNKLQAFMPFQTDKPVASNQADWLHDNDNQQHKVYEV